MRIVSSVMGLKNISIYVSVMGRAITMAAQAFVQCPAALTERAQLVAELLAVVPNRRGFKVNRDLSVSVYRYPVPNRHSARLAEKQKGAHQADGEAGARSACSPISSTRASDHRRGAKLPIYERTRVKTQEPKSYGRGTLVVGVP